MGIASNGTSLVFRHWERAGLKSGTGDEKEDASQRIVNTSGVTGRYRCSNQMENGQEDQANARCYPITSCRAFQMRFWVALYPDREIAEASSSRRRKEQRLSAAEAADCVMGAPESLPSTRSPPRGAVKDYARRSLRNALDSAACWVQIRPSDVVTIKFGEYAFLFAALTKVLPEPFRCTCELVARKLLNFAMEVRASCILVADSVVSIQTSGSLKADEYHFNYCDFLWALAAHKKLDMEATGTFLPGLHKEWIQLRTRRCSSKVQYF